MWNVLVVDDDRNLTKLLDFALQQAGFAVTIARDGTEGLVMAKARPPDVAVVDVMMPGVHGYELCRRLRTYPGTAHCRIIILTARSQPIDEKEGIKAGADLFVSKPVTPDELIEKVRSLAAGGAEREQAPAEPEVPSAQASRTESVAGEDERALDAESPPSLDGAPDKPAGRLFSCFAGCPDVGVTTVAANLALAFSLSRQAETPLVELHSTPGNLPTVLGLASGPPYGDLKATGTRLTWDTLPLHLMDHPTGVRVLPAPPLGSDVPANLTQHALSLLRSQYPVVLTDTWCDRDERVESVLPSSDLVLMVTTPESAALRATLDAIQWLLERGFPRRQVLLVVNSVRAQHSVPLEQIRESLKQPILGVVPYEPAMETVIDIGRPIILSQPRSPASVSLGRMAMQLSRGLG
jgi:CheY-like chemotaxis protein/MinD-like ATPase involved in chromosome partitioning or flagellar assembly